MVSLIVHPFRAYKQIQLDGKTKSVWYPRLHFHVVGFGWLNHIVENYHKSGWVVKNKGERDSKLWNNSLYFYLMLELRKGIIL